jgi:hypothetical protein
MRRPPAEELAQRSPGSCRLSTRRHSLLGSSFARCGTGPSSRSADRPTAGPQRGCRVAHAQATTGQDASFTPGTVVRSRPATTLRPAPAAFQRPVPTALLLHPIDRGHFHEASTEVHAIRPSSRRPHRRQDRGAPSPPVFSLPVAPGWNRNPWASSPSFAPRSHPRRTSRRRQANTHWPGYYTSSFIG